MLILLPNNRRPVEESARPFRELTDDSIKAHVRPLSSGAANITAARHDAGNGSFMAKWQLPRGGSRLHQDVLWQTRGRWISELTGLGVQAADRDLAQWHIFTWVSLRDDTYLVYFDEHLVQEGTLRWTLGGTSMGDELNMSFLFDLAWGHTQVSEVNVSLPVSDGPIRTYELDYSRVYLRE